MLRPWAMRQGTLKVSNQKNSPTMGANYNYDGLPRCAYKFTGKERDSESGLDYFGARHYGSSLGRFMTPDPGQASGFDHMDDPQSWEWVRLCSKQPADIHRS